MLFMGLRLLMWGERGRFWRFDVLWKILDGEGRVWLVFCGVFLKGVRGLGFFARDF